MLSTAWNFAKVISASTQNVKKVNVYETDTSSSVLHLLELGSSVSSAGRFWFVGSGDLNWTITQVMLSQPVPSPRVFGARQWSNSWKSMWKMYYRCIKSTSTHLKLLFIYKLITKLKLSSNLILVFFTTYIFEIWQEIYP